MLGPPIYGLRRLYASKEELVRVGRAGKPRGRSGPRGHEGLFEKAWAGSRCTAPRLLTWDVRAGVPAFPIRIGCRGGVKAVGFPEGMNRLVSGAGPPRGGYRLSCVCAQGYCLDCSTRGAGSKGGGGGNRAGWAVWRSGAADRAPPRCPSKQALRSRVVRGYCPIACPFIL